VTQLTLVSLNTRGLPLFGSALRTRYTAIAGALERSETDVVNLQEVLTYRHLHLLRRSMPSYRANYRPSAAGPAGGLVTFTRHPAEGTTYRRLPRLSLKGVLFTTLPELTILNTHLRANRDGDWSPTSRYYRIHESQLTALAQYVETVNGPAVLTGDFNVPRHSNLYRDFLHKSGLTDSFGDDCPPTFHQTYLPPGRPSHCIDFALLAGPTADSAEVDGTYPSDHLALHVRLNL
jgi:endonuclease/exonuclease/phosphatase (EEP) superfamily protein YafD